MMKKFLFALMAAGAICSQLHAHPDGVDDEGHANRSVTPTGLLDLPSDVLLLIESYTQNNEYIHRDDDGNEKKIVVYSALAGVSKRFNELVLKHRNGAKDFFNQFPFVYRSIFNVSADSKWDSKFATEESSENGAKSRRTLRQFRAFQLDRLSNVKLAIQEEQGEDMVPFFWKALQYVGQLSFLDSMLAEENRDELINGWVWAFANLLMINKLDDAQFEQLNRRLNGDWGHDPNRNTFYLSLDPSRIMAPGDGFGLQTVTMQNHMVRIWNDIFDENDQGNFQAFKTSRFPIDPILLHMQRRFVSVDILNRFYDPEGVLTPEESATIERSRGLGVIPPAAEGPRRLGIVKLLNGAADNADGE